MNDIRIVALSTIADSGRLRFSDHYYSQLHKRPTPTESEVYYLLRDDEPEVIEDYPNDPRGSSFLVFGTTDNNGRIAHAVCTAPPESMVITSYFPAETHPEKWDDDFRSRKEGDTS